jgi:hypothetical protein
MIAGTESPQRRPGQIVAAEVLRLCNGVMEAAWLAAFVLVPILCNPHSQSAYQPNKMAFLRLLAFIMAAAWITKSSGDERSFRARADEALRFGLRCPLVLAISALALGYGLATVFSVNPNASLWGSYEMVQGTFTFGCVLLLCAALAVNLRRREQVERLITTITVASFPLALYGLIERAGYDSLPRPAQLGLLYLEWAADETDPATRLNLANKADRAFERALAIEPTQEMVWHQSAAVDILLPGREVEGQAKIRRAAELVRNQDQSEFADYYAGMSRAVNNILLKRQYGSYALEYYGNALKAAAATGASTTDLIAAENRLRLELSAYGAP